MTSTYHQADVTAGVQQRLLNAAAELGIAQAPDGSYDVFYGDQINLPRQPAICVEPAPMKRIMEGASRPPRMQNVFNVLIMVYLQSLSGIQQLDKAKDALLDKVQDVMHADWTLGGLVLFGYCEDIDPGYALRANQLMRVGKISYTAMNKTFLIDPASVEVP